MENLAAAASQFAVSSQILDIQEYGRGNVNDTFLVTVAGAGENRFILQRLNPRVFPRPQLIMRNLRLLTEHLNARLHPDRPGAGRRWETPRALLTREGADHWQDPGGSCWRGLSFIAAARSFDTIQDLDHAREVGYALGRFHYLLSDLPAGRLADTLPGFHITPGYLENYDEVLGQGTKSPPKPGSPEVNYCLEFIEKRRAGAGVLEEAKAQERLQLRSIHGDPKVDNFMMDRSSGLAVGLVDLDTVKPGLVHYDLGDCLRSACNPLGEEPERWEETHFQPEICQAVLKGYFLLAREFLLGNDYEYLYDAIRLLPFELGLRFFTDHLAGNVYFKARHPEQNLRRALTQFRLAASVEVQERGIRAIIQDLRRQCRNDSQSIGG